VVEPRAGKAEGHAPHGDRVGQLGIQAPAAELATRDPSRDQHADPEQETVPAGVDRPRVDHEGVARAWNREHGHGRKAYMQVRWTGAFVSNVYRQTNKFPLPREEELQEAPMSPVPIRLKNAHLGADRRSALPSPDPR